MYGGYGIGKPAQPAVAAQPGRLGRHEGADGDDVAPRAGVSVAQANVVVKPGVVELEPALCRVSGQEDEVLIADQVDLGDHRPSGIQLSLDDAQVGADPPGEGDAAAGVTGDRIPDQLVVLGVTAVRRQ